MIKHHMTHAVLYKNDWWTFIKTPAAEKQPNHSLSLLTAGPLVWRHDIWHAYSGTPRCLQRDPSINKRKRKEKRQTSVHSLTEAGDKTCSRLSLSNKLLPKRHYPTPASEWVREWVTEWLDWLWRKKNIACVVHMIPPSTKYLSYQHRPIDQQPIKSNQFNSIQINSN